MSLTILPCPTCGVERAVKPSRGSTTCKHCRRWPRAPRMVPGAWVDKGLCRTSSQPDAWYTNDEAQIEYAMLHCAACPVRRHCRDYAVSADEEFGIWGMTTPEMRRNITKGKAA